LQTCLLSRKHPFAVIRRLHDRNDLESSREENPNFAGTLAKGLMILEAFVRESRPLGNSELAQMLGLTRPTVSRLCRTLLELGYLDHDDRIDRYFIGPAAVAMGYPYIVNTPLRLVARPAMQALADRFQGAVSIGVAFGLDMVYLETCACPTSTLARPDTGAVRSIASTAMGRAWLASLAPAGLAELKAALKRGRPEEWQRCQAGVKESMDQYAKRGFAVNLGDAGLGVFGVGVHSRIRYGQRALVFNCALPGRQSSAARLLRDAGPALIALVRGAERQAGLS
jgi:DNA-binding IclR family transcriptional regulator